MDPSKMTAKEILELEYGDSVNFMAPNLVRVGKLGDRVAYEVSEGVNMDMNGPFYGVSTVLVREDGKTTRGGVKGTFASRSMLAIECWLEDREEEVENGDYSRWT